MMITYDSAARKALKKMGKDEAQRMVTAIERLPSGDVKKLGGRDGYRMRIGGWRVIFDMDGQTITVRMIRSRGDVYNR
jgi:mRNA interferase RelE/StbE